MKPFDFNKYIKNNPLLKEGKLENEMYNALENFDTNSDKERISALQTILNKVLTPEQKQMSNQIIQDAKKKTAENKERPESFAYYAMHDIADDPEGYNPLGLSKQQFNQVINVLWGEPIGVGAGEPSGDVTDQLQSLGYTVDEYETADAIGVTIKKDAKTVAKREFDNTDPENQEDIQDFLKDFLAKVSKVKR